VGKNGKPVTTPGADPNLKTARENVADVSARNGRVYSRTPSAAELKNPGWPRRKRAHELGCPHTSVLRAGADGEAVGVEFQGAASFDL